MLDQTNRHRLLYAGNKAQLVPLLDNVIQMAEDLSETTSQKLAINFLCKCVTTWGQANPAVNGGDGTTPALPGFESFIYERLFPLAFSIPSNPSFNIKDGQTIVVSSMINALSYSILLLL